MRYQPLQTNAAQSKSSIAAVWPTVEEVLLRRQPPALQRETVAVAPAESLAPAAAPSPETAAPDIPAAVGGLIAASYAALLAVFFALFAGSPLALFSITICAVFVAVFFAVPRIFFAVEADSARRPSLSRFWHDGLQTLTGRCSGRDALIQMLIVPVFLGLGLLTIGIIGKVYIG